MRRRLTFAIVGVAAGALLVAGLGVLVLLTAGSRRETRHDAMGLAARIADEYAHPEGAPPPALSRLQNVLKRTQTLALITLDTGGSTTTPLPAGLTASDLRPPSLATGTSVSGNKGSTAYAVVPFSAGLNPRAGRRTLAVVVTQRSASPAGAGLYVLVAGAVVLVAAAGVAATIAARITRPLVAVGAAAGRIAHGELSARVGEHRGGYPELDCLSASLDAMAENLERLRGQERQFLLSISHDLRTPLTSIRGFAEALTDGTATDTTKAAEIIGTEARRLERLVGDLLDMARLDAHAFSLDVRATDLSEVVADVAHGFSPTAEQLGLQVVVHEPVVDPLCMVGGRQAPLVAADADRLAQVVANLMENACKYAESTIDVSTWYRLGPGGPEAQVTVDDDGPGIAASDLPHVFERLWTSSDGAPRRVGSGLGLAIVAQLIGAMGGTVRAESPRPAEPSGSAEPARGRGPGTRLIVSLRAAPR